MTYKTTREKNREIRHITQGENARLAIGDITKNCDIYGLNKGQFSIINIIEEVLKQVGGGDVVISTWTAAKYEMTKAEEFINKGLFNSIKFIVDRSFKTRQPKYYKILNDKFGDIVYETNSHAKFVLIKNNDWNIVIRTSMNLNENKRLENFEISDDENFFKYMAELCNDITNTKDFSYQAFEDLGNDKKYDKYRPKIKKTSFNLDEELKKLGI